MEFIPKKDERKILSKIGVNSISELFSDIPRSIQINSLLNLEPPKSEADLKKAIKNITDKNKLYKTSFLGAGAYDHYIPSIVNHIISRSEFYTAYTPYQAEISQGTLQAMFEYQTMICNLTGMDVSNASLYDGAESLAEAALICLSRTNRKEIIISKTVHPQYRQVVKTYLEAQDKKLIEVDFTLRGKTDLDELKKIISADTAAVLVQSPNFFGVFEDLTEIRKIADSVETLLTVSISDPSCLGLIKPPGEFGADIVTADGQSFGSPKLFGGPYLGILAVKKDLMRYIPGRVCGQTIDTNGKTGYVLTLQAREQHIRREKASCNICSNQALNALSSAVYLASLGKKGMQDLANHNFQKAHYTAKRLEEIGLSRMFRSLHYNEFVIDLGQDPEKIVMELEKFNIQAGLPLADYYPNLKNCMLFCVTEQNSVEDIENLIKTIIRVI